MFPESGKVHEQKKIADHGYKNFVFPNHENKQPVSYFFLMTCPYTRNSVKKKGKSTMAKSRLYIANRMPKSLSIDHSNHSEDFHLKIP